MNTGIISANCGSPCTPPLSEQVRQDGPIRPEQRRLLTELIFQRIGNEEEREQFLSETDSLSMMDASERIANLSA